MSIHGKAPNPEKGARYLGLLDNALCSANWSDIPELARKVDKHAPQRKCLTLAARAQCQIVAASHRPTSASSVTSTSIHGLGELIPRLIESIAGAIQSHPDDAYIGSTCLAEIHWLRETPLEALKALNDAASGSNSSSSSTALGWLEVCRVKAGFIHASCLDISGRQSEARESFHAAVAMTPGYRSPEMRRWTERLLAQACMYCVKNMRSPSLQDYTDTCSAFRAWGQFWERAPATSASDSSSSRLDIPRRQVWAVYYELLSTLLQRNLLPDVQSGRIAVANDMPLAQRAAARQRQRAEMKKVEVTYETFLLSETKFPKASQSNSEVEEWCEQAMANWRVFSGPTWTDNDLGDGGKRTVSRGVLDLLYRAATKSFHSTPILRHLFTVHAALGEFDLAMHAFNSYVEIVDKGKARAEKTGKHEIGFDDDDTAMLTTVDAVRVLCRYGDRDQAEKAVEVSKSMQKWLEQQRPTTEQLHDTDGTVNGYHERSVSQPTAAFLKASTLGAVYRAIGISQARWAQLTFESETRSTLLSKARSNLQRALTYDADSIETSHALALVLAELRDVSGAISVIRSAIEQTPNEVAGDGKAALASFDHQRRLMPMWHLLALCLTGEDQFEAAAQICQASYRQCGISQSLFGSTSSLDSREDVSHETSLADSIVDQMETFEKESMIQIKMTQIMLFELMEGPEEATDLTDELSSLYSRLFGNPEQIVAELVSKPPQTAASHAPSKLGGTLRSITGSMRPRTARSVRSTERDNAERVSDVSRDTSDLTPQPTTNGTPIAITVTNEDGVHSEKPQHRHHLPHLPFHGRSRRSSSTRSRSPARSMTRSGDATTEKYAPAAADVSVADTAKPEQPLDKIPHNTPNDSMPPPPGHQDQPPRQDVRLPAPHPATAAATPEPQMSSLYERRHKVSVLVKAWLFSAGLYLRATLYDDAENLVNDATKLVESLELQLTKSEDGANARRLFHRGWGSGKSIDELWADLWTIKAQLATGRERPHDAIIAYEKALAHDPDHPAGVVGLSNLLMDIYEEKLPVEEPIADIQPSPAVSNSLIAEAKPSVTRPTSSSSLPSRRPSVIIEAEPFEGKERKTEPSPAELNRLAARDRAYMLLSNLTKQGAGWDDSEAWYTLARAHELSREIGKAKQALWWVVELENNRPIRPWKDVSPGGYTL